MLDDMDFFPSFESGHVDIFFSYAHEDEKLMHFVRRHLVVFDHEGILSKWYDGKILAGQDWAGEIDQHLFYSGIILLFISAHFFDSKYCYKVEMPPALRRHEAGEAVVIPVILRPCAWDTAPFRHLKAVPADGRPITEWPNRDVACLNAALSIVEVVRSIANRKHPQRQKELPPPKPNGSRRAELEYRLQQVQRSFEECVRARAPRSTIKMQLDEIEALRKDIIAHDNA
jgi:hypothetical protein